MDDVDHNLLYWLKCLCRFFLIEKGQDEKNVRLFHSAMVNEPETNSRKARAHSPQTKIQQRAAAIVEETAQVAITGNVLPGYCDSFSGQYKCVPQLSAAIKGPPEEYAWTMALSGYEAARSSAVNALHYEWACGRAARAGHNSKTPRLDVLLFQIRAGQIKKGDPVIQEAIAYADKHGFSGNIRERIVQELHNAEKRVEKDYCGVQIGSSLFYDLNPFHLVLAASWVGGLFWLMSDRLIAKFLLNNRALPPTTRQAVSQTVSKMGLVKHEPRLVKSVGRGFELVFVEGYPLKS